MLRALTTPATFERALGLLLVLNLLDAAFTSLWVSAGVVTEGNPMMAAAIDQGFGPFVLGKVALVGFGALLLWRHRDQLFARVALVPAALLYSFVLGSHLGIGAMVVAA